MKILSHVVTFDTGLAPNPFHGFCTTAVCTPSHRGAKLDHGDWIVGHTSAGAAKPRHIVYAMRVSEVLGLDEYFHDPRFEAKKPQSGTPKQRCGDNIYYRVGDHWDRIRPSLHDDDKSFYQDVGKGDRKSFISDHFFYFGDRAVPFEEGMTYMIHSAPSFHYVYGSRADAFVEWLESAHRPPGLKGLPRDFDTGFRCSPAPCASRSRPRAAVEPKLQQGSENRI